MSATGLVRSGQARVIATGAMTPAMLACRTACGVVAVHKFYGRLGHWRHSEGNWHMPATRSTFNCCKRGIVRLRGLARGRSVLVIAKAPQGHAVIKQHGIYSDAVRTLRGTEGQIQRCVIAVVLSRHPWRVRHRAQLLVPEARPVVVEVQLVCAGKPWLKTQQSITHERVLWTRFLIVLGQTRLNNRRGELDKQWITWDSERDYNEPQHGAVSENFP